MDNNLYFNSFNQEKEKCATCSGTGRVWNSAGWPYPAQSDGYVMCPICSGTGYKRL